jgi:hypothetical protein
MSDQEIVKFNKNQSAIYRMYSPNRWERHCQGSFGDDDDLPLIEPHNF